MADEVRMIDKDKLIKKINAENDAWAKSRMCMTADELLETIEEFEEEAEPDNGWISVKDRLPDKAGDYLCMVKRYLDPKHIQADHNKSLEQVLEEGAVIGYEVSWCCKGGFKREVTHWRYLPEPPKGE